MKKALAVALFVGMAVCSFAQMVPCDLTVWDGAGVLTANDIASIGNQAAPLKEQGADVHILTANLSGSSLDQLVAGLKQSCPSWRSANGGVKTNMLVVAVAPKEHKMGIFYGPGYTAALGGQTDRIKRDYMGPHFKGADWTGGLVASEQQLTARIKASLDESNKPINNQTINPPVDYHGLWIFFWILGIIGCSGFAVWLIIRIRKAKEETTTAQMEAIASRSRVVDQIAALNSRIGNSSLSPGYVQATNILNSVSTQYSSLASTQSGDPTEMGMAKSYYMALDHAYGLLYDDLQEAFSYLNGTHAVDKRSAPKEEETVSQNLTGTGVPSPVKETTVVVKDGGGSDLLTGVLIGEELNRPAYREPEPEPERHHHREEPSYSRSSDSDSDSGGGWSGSSSDFGGSSDSGGSSSDFGGGGSDFGGGSSDF